MSNADSDSEGIAPGLGRRRAQSQPSNAQQYLGDTSSDEEDNDGDKPDDPSAYKQLGEAFVYTKARDKHPWNTHELLFKLRAKDSSEAQAVSSVLLYMRKTARGKEAWVLGQPRMLRSTCFGLHCLAQLSSMYQPSRLTTRCPRLSWCRKSM